MHSSDIPHELTGEIEIVKHDGFRDCGGVIKIRGGKMSKKYSFKEISMKVISSSKQRYDTCGDYWLDKNGVQFRVSNLKDWRMHILVLIHELAEWAMLQDRGVTVGAVDKFDMNFEKEREQGLHRPEEEPGDAKDCPYRKEHAIATKIEKLMAKELGIDWDAYDKAVMES